MNMQQVEIWLEGIPSKQTKKSYRNALRKFEEWYKRPIESLIGSSDEATRTVERFFCYLKENYCQNTARSTTNGVIQYFKAHKTEIKLRKALNVYHTVVTIRDHQLTTSEVQAMAKVADLREQLILKVGFLGLRIGDVANLRWKTFDVYGEPPIEIEIMTHKEDQIARTFIDSEMKELLDVYLQQIDKSNPYLFQSKRQGNLSGKRIDEILKQLFERAGLKTSKILRWHCFRKLVMRTAMELGLNSWSIKIMVGKAVSADITTYISGVSLKEDFLKLSNILKLFPRQQASNGSTKQILDTVMKALRTLVEEELKRQGLSFKRRDFTPNEKELESAKKRNKELVEIWAELEELMKQ